MRSLRLIASCCWLMAILGVVARAQAPAKPMATNLHENDAEIRALYDHWAKVFEARDIDGIMSLYVSGDQLVAYDVVPPLQYQGSDAYRKDYVDFLNQFEGPVHVEYRDLQVFSSGSVGFVHALERFTGKMKNGQSVDMWLRATSGVVKVDGKWLIVHDHISVPADLDTGK